MLKITTEQQVRLHAAFLTGAGAPAPIEGTPAWATAQPTIIDLIPDADGLGALVKSKAIGAAQITVEADADLTTGTRTITGTIGIEVIEAGAETVEITADPPEFKTVILTVTATPQPDGTVLLTGHGNPNTLYQVEAADAITGPWAVIGTMLTDSSGNGSYIDTDAPAHPTRFYRLRWP
jgi:hypothetical protein